MLGHSHSTSGALAWGAAAAAAPVTWWADLLGTHPPMRLRIARLNAMGYLGAPAVAATTPVATPAT